MQRNLDAITLIPSNDQWLNPLILNAIFYAAGIMMAFLFSSGRIFGFFRPNLVQVVGQGIHVTGVIIQPLIEGDLDINGRDIIIAYGGRLGA